MYLIGDIGGTYCRLCTVTPEGIMLDLRVYPSRDLTSFTEAVTRYIAGSPYQHRAACFGLPGPVVGRRCILANLPWVVEVDELEAATRISEIVLLNDGQTWAYGLDELGPDDRLTLEEGEPSAHGNRALFAPGTGIAEAALIEVGDDSFALASEGGHADIGPINALEFGFVEYLLRDFNAATYELAVSGPGLCRLFDYLVETRRRTPAAEVVAALAAPGVNRAATISAAALAERCPACISALDLWVGFLAAEAANVVLKFVAVGGLYFGGGIIPRILPAIQTPRFRQRFTARDKMHKLLKAVPLHIVLDDEIGLKGASVYALRCFGEARSPDQTSGPYGDAPR